MRNPAKSTTTFNLGNFITGALFGGLAGATVMLLTAPQSGKKTRTQIQQKTLELRDDVADKLDDVWQQTEDTVRRARLKTRQVKREAETAVKELRHRGQTLIADQRERVGAALESLQPGSSNGHD